MSAGKTLQHIASGEKNRKMVKAPRHFPRICSRKMNLRNLRNLRKKKKVWPFFTLVSLLAASAAGEEGSQFHPQSQGGYRQHHAADSRLSKRHATPFYQLFVSRPPTSPHHHHHHRRRLQQRQLPACSPAKGSRMAAARGIIIQSPKSKGEKRKKNVNRDFNKRLREGHCLRGLPWEKGAEGH